VQERTQHELRASEVRALHGRVQELTLALQGSARHQGELQRIVHAKELLVGSQAAQISQLTLERDQLQRRVSELEAAVQDVDTRKQLELLQVQHNQVHTLPLGGIGIGKLDEWVRRGADFARSPRLPLN
jgi:hypothetical protein